ncbi:trypco2 family protein [Streptomyces sp. NPDC049627]|uniref:trypco2 family protein n=1 Tax=Streptomyces sp. NPDC049627 TaxID=3365595 RepID=UPI003796B66F
MTQPDSGPDLVAVLEKLRADLTEAKLNAEESSDGPMLSLSKAEIEMEVAVQDTAEGGGGIKFSVLTLGAKKSRSKGATHKLKIELSPLGLVAVAPSESGRFEPPPGR